jgi:hypothetical protein
MKRSLFNLGIGIAALMGGAVLLGADKATPPRGEPIKPLAPKAETPVIKPEVASSPTAAAPTVASGDFLALGFDKLSGFKYEVPDDAIKPGTPSPDKQIPDAVKGLDGKRVSLKGFMLPLKVEGGLVTEMLILRDQSACCFGATPKINEWVSVKMTGAGVKPIMDQAVTLYGKLKVGAVIESGYVVGIYQLDGEKMQGPPGT